MKTVTVELDVEDHFRLDHLFTHPTILAAVYVPPVWESYSPEKRQLAMMCLKLARVEYPNQPKISAIKNFRAISGWGLREAKEIIERAKERAPAP